MNEQAAGRILFLTHADTDVLAVASIAATLDPQLPPVRVHNVGPLRDEDEALAFFEATVPGAAIILVKLHGGVRSLPGFADLVRLAERERAWVVAMPGTDDLDPELTAYSTAGIPVSHDAKAYLQLGGLENYRQCLYFLSDHLLATGIGYAPPAEQPRAGVYHPRVPEGTVAAWQAQADFSRPTVGVTFYRSYWLTGDTAFIDTLVEAGDSLGANVLPVFAYSLKDGDDSRHPDALRYFINDGEDGRPLVDVVLNTMSFAMGSSSPDERSDEEWAVDALRALDVPQLQAVNASVSSAEWLASEGGLSPLDVAMNVAIPELDGRIISIPLSFKEQQAGIEVAGTPVVRHVALRDRADRVMGLALRLAALRRKANGEKRVAVVLTNHNAKASRIANAVGLDSPASLLHLLHCMRAAGYEVGDVLPPDSDTLMADLVERGHYDRDLLTHEQLEGALARVPAARYGEWFGELPSGRADEMRAQWGAPPGVYYTDDGGTLALAGLRFGNVFVAVQPPRGYGMDKTASMHKPDLAPTYPYHALYRWLAEPTGAAGFGADAVVHMGKHGSLEWLPGKGVGLSAECYPDLFLGDLPLIYPFIVDDPGEGAAAKRRAHAVIVDHLPPPMATAETYGDLDQLERLVDEYYLLERTDPGRLPLLQEQIRALLAQANLEGEIETLLREHAEESGVALMDDPLSVTHLSGADFADVVEDIHAYMHELGMAPIREGLHVLGVPPEGEPLIDSVMMLVRLRNGSVPSLRDSVGLAYGFDQRAAAKEPGARISTVAALAADAAMTIEANADAIEAVQALSRALLARLLNARFDRAAIDGAIAVTLPGAHDRDGLAQTGEALAFVCGRLVPALRRTDEEIIHILDALDGRYVPPGPSGAPTRGMAHVLPTGRNFYSVDPRSIPSSTAWLVGTDLARGVVDRYVREEGAVPESVGISIWGTAAMRTSGDDIAQVLSLLGVRPVWQLESRRVIGVEIVPLEELGRPRIDVVCRISGFFRDAFPHAIALLDDAFERVSRLDEPLDRNFVRAHRLATRDRLRLEGLGEGEAWQRAGYRIFGSKPGTYGAGILQLVDEQAWHDDADLAATYVNWGGYAYTRQEFGIDARGAFREALAQVAVAVKNQDNREHDIFDSDDYFQFHGGMIASIRALTGRNPRAYFGDTQDPDRPNVRTLKDEANRVFRSRVVNPKWLDAMQRHGYKGALEVAATVDYLFGYDATAQVVDDWQYEEVTRSTLLDPTMQAFFARSNPWAMRDIAERLLEAIQRGMWAAPSEEMLAAIRQTFLLAEGNIEDGRPAVGDAS
jgi:cobaltochelatase CobN